VSSLQVLGFQGLVYVCESGEWGVYDMLDGRKEMMEHGLGVTRARHYELHNGTDMFLTGGTVLKMYKLQGNL
jgi:hypothetical protein